ncbi:MAG: hypothetical protein ACKVS5_09170 [Parvularculaceae bacterium]
MMRSLVIAALLFATSATAEQGDDSVAKARADLRQRLETASETGIVTIRGGKQASPPSNVAASTTPALRLFDRSECLTVEALARSDAQLRDDPAGGLERLRRALLDDSTAFRELRDLELARGYLALGFAEEARAIATAQPGVEAAGIAGLGFLAEGNALSASASISGVEFCGGLYAFIRDLASFLRGEVERLPDSAASTLDALPAGLRTPLSEALAIAAVAYNKDAPERIDDALRHGDESGHSASRVLLHALKAEDAAGTKRLASIASEPSPIRQVALRELGKRIDASKPSEIVTGFGLDLEDEAAASLKSQPAWGLALQLAARRLSSGNIDGGVKALGAAFRNPSTRNAAIDRFRELEKSLAASVHADQRLQHLAVVFAEPDLTAASLKADRMKVLATSAAELGAADALTRLRGAMPAIEAIDDLSLGEALMRSGQEAEASEIVRENSSDPRFAALALHLALASGNKSAELAAAKRQGSDAIGAALWRQGDFDALLAFDTEDPVSSETSIRIALAAIALKQAAPPRALRQVDEPDALQSLFADGSRLDLHDLSAVRRFSESTAKAVSFLKARMNDE